MHPEYDPETVDYDIALIKLQSPAKLNDYVTPACLPSNTDNLNQTFPPGLNCEVSGWGSINPNIDDEEERKFGPVLKHDKAKLFSLEKCREYYDELDELVSDQMMCAGELQPYLLYSYPLYFHQFKYAIIAIQSKVCGDSCHFIIPTTPEVFPAWWRMVPVIP